MAYDCFAVVQVLENTEGGSAGSLVACLDMCTTVMGKRQLRAWLCRPMARIADITARQDAVADLMGPAADAAQAARTALTGKPLPLSMISLRCLCYRAQTSPSLPVSHLFWPSDLKLEGVP